MELYIIRHTPVALDRSYCYGQSDVDVADSYEADRDGILSHLPRDRNEWRCLSSPLSRCHRLASDIMGEENVESDSRLMEMSFGQWEMQRWEDLPKKEFDEWKRDIESVVPPGGESYGDVRRRVLDFYEDLRNSSSPKVMIVAHAGVLHALIPHLLSMPPGPSPLLRFDYASVNRFQVDGDRVVVHYLNRV